MLFTLQSCIRFNLTSQRTKRKISVQDSDESDSTLAKVSNRTKKRRISRAPSEEPEENEETAIGKRSFTEKLHKFRKSPQEKAPCMRFLTLYFPLLALTIHTDKKRKPTNDDDDDYFIVPDDANDSDIASIPSDGDRRSTSRSSARSVSGLESDEDGENEVSNRKKAVSKPSGKSQTSNAAAAPFLTAAERSMQDKKLGRKSVEKPFNFLKDIKDKDGIRPGEPGYDPRTIYVPESSWAEFTPFEKQV